MKIKSIAAVLTASAMLLSSCGNAAPAETSEVVSASPSSTEIVVETETSAEVSSTEENGERVTLTVATAHLGSMADWDTNYTTQLLEEKFNVNLEVMELPQGAELQQKLSLMVSSGEELPDIIMYNWISSEEAFMFGQAGAYIPLNEYYEDEAMSPNFHNLPQDVQDLMLRSYTSADGNIYGVGSYYPNLSDQYPLRAWINQTWLDALGLEMPETTEEFYQVLKAFKEQDPNGNGKADEVPITGSMSGWKNNPLPWIMNAFLQSGDGRSNFYVEDGKIIPAFTQEAWRDGLEYINRLVQEELLSPTTFTQDWNQVKTLAESGEDPVIGCVVAFTPPFTDGSERYEDIEVLPPLTGPEGVCWSTLIKDPPHIMYAITRDCEYPELAFQIADYGYNSDMSMITRHGEHGVDWDTNVDGLVSLYEEDFGVEPAFRQINTLDLDQNSSWTQQFPCYEDSIASKKGEAVDPETARRMDVLIPQMAAIYQEKAPEEVIVSYLQTAEETEELATLKADINTYVQECMVRFATGEMPLTEWDNYLDTLNSMGIERYTELLQAGYDRYNAQ